MKMGRYKIYELQLDSESTIEVIPEEWVNEHSQVRWNKDAVKYAQSGKAPNQRWKIYNVKPLISRQYRTYLAAKKIADIMRDGNTDDNCCNNDDSDDNIEEISTISSIGNKNKPIASSSLEDVELIEPKTETITASAAYGKLNNSEMIINNMDIEIIQNQDQPYINFHSVNDNNDLKIESSFTMNPQDIDPLSHEDSLTARAMNELSQLLHKLGCSSWYSIFCEEMIDIHIMKIMTVDHFRRLADKRNIKMGHQIKFETILNNWQLSLKDTNRPNLFNEPTSGGYNNKKLDDHLPKLVANFDAPKELITEITENLIGIKSIIKDLFSSTDFFRTSQELDLQILRKEFEVDKALTKNIQRIEISRVVIKTILQKENNLELNRYDFLFLAHSICRYFNTEIPGTYYSAGIGVKVSGKLYDCYCNYRTKLSNCGLIRRRRKMPNHSKSIDMADENSTENE